ncbi:hypothetical protein DUI87_01015 [Hirundo rustica rustica]|uniref:Uncharacterized protein n=1 Tax=Hirundo rustica rustica TaxID=333673 RepID=A0A3M0L3Q7_HIRRU|nr:hypothetical protein DUI87_01015 [Hirundo rustica rustica]
MPSLDLKDAFFCLPLHEASQKIFAFEWESPKTGRKTQLTWCVLPQKYKNSPTIFGEQLAKDLESWEPPPGEGQLLQYVDDLLIATQTQETCVDWTVSLLNFLGLQGYRVSQKKAQMVRQTVIHLGYKVSAGQRTLGQDRKEAICQTPKPQTVKELRTFLGMTGWCRLWIYNYGLLVKPLYALITEGSRGLQWTKEATRAFDQLKKALMSAPALGLPYRFLKYQAILVEQDDVEIVVTNIVNPASFLSGSTGEPVIHECLETIEATYSSRPDLKDTLLEDAETWFTHGSSYVVSGRRHAGYAVTTSKEDGFHEAYHPPMKLIRVSPECCDKCLSTCLEFRLKIEGCALRGYDIDFNITQVCTEYHKNQTKITPPVPRKAVITKMPAIPEIEEQITPVITKIGPFAIKKTGVQKLIVNPKWSLKRVEMGVQIPLHPDDAPRFAFSVPTLNREAPRKRYHWKFLPQGMKNSPSICQWYLSSLLSPVCAAVGETIILHYMDDVLVCAPNDDLLSHALDLTINSLVAAGFELQEEKIQRMPPWKYLGLEIVGKSGKIKKDKDCRDPLLIIEWVFLSHHWSKRMTRPQELGAELIQKARTRIRELAGCDFECIHIPVEIKAMLEHLLHENEALQFALDSYTGQISIHSPAHKLFREQIQFKLSLKSVQSRRPLKALTIFTDASGTSHKSVITWKNPQTQQWEKDIVEVEGSPQVAELAAVVRAFERFPEPFNLVTDSAYVAGVVSRAKQAVLSEVSNTSLFNLLSKLVNLISHREQQFYVMHIRSHTDLPGFIAEGNRRADALAAPSEMAPLPDIFGQAKISHQLFHQNAPGLVRQFHLTQEQARAIAAMCPSYQQHALPALSAGANPRGLNSCEVWQMDVSHIMPFGRQRYVHVSVDTFSGAVYASDHTGEKSSDVMKHLIQAFSFLGIPKSIITDNGPTYTSKEFRSFLQQWGVEHCPGLGQIWEKTPV